MTVDRMFASPTDTDGSADSRPDAADDPGTRRPGSGPVLVQPVQQGIQSVEIAMRVLQALEQGAGPMTLSQVAAQSEMQPSKLHRYLVSLSRVGLVAKSPVSGRYDLGPAMRRLGAEALRRGDEVSAISSHLPALRDRTQHAVNLSVWGDNGPVVVRWDYGAYALPITIRVGATLPLLASAVGQVFLAYLPAALTTPLVQAQAALEDRAAGDVSDQVRSIVSEVRRRGVALNPGTLIPGLVSIAAPVFATGSSFPLVVALAVPHLHASPEVIASLSSELISAAESMSAELGSVRPAPHAPTA